MSEQVNHDSYLKVIFSKKFDSSQIVKIIMHLLVLAYVKSCFSLLRC